MFLCRQEVHHRGQWRVSSIHLFRPPEDHRSELWIISGSIYEGFIFLRFHTFASKKMITNYNSDSDAKQNVCGSFSLSETPRSSVPQRPFYFLRILMICRWADVRHANASRAIGGDEWNQRWAFAWSHNTHHSLANGFLLQLLQGVTCHYRKWHVQSETTNNRFLPQLSHSSSWTNGSFWQWDALVIIGR